MMGIKIVEQISPKRIEGRADVLRVEQRLSGIFPDDYLHFLVQNNGGRAESSVFVFDDTKGQQADSLVDWFFGVCDDPDYGIEPNLDAYEGRVPNGFCPIACDPFGNLLLIGFRDENRGDIYFWDHELEEDEPTMANMSKVATSFSGFLALVK